MERALNNLPYIMGFTVDWSGGGRLQREKHQPKAPQEHSDEEIEVMPAESVPPERKSTV